MTGEAAHRVYKLLMVLCDAPPSLLDSFVSNQTEEFPCPEFRFQGSLGFGGKFYCERDRWRVDCYREDKIPVRREAIAATNEALEQLYKEYGP